MSKYSNQHNDPYCYKDTDILVNKKNLLTQEKLDQLERIYTSKRLLELKKNPILGTFDLGHLQKIHEYIFQDIYDFAGKIRTVNIGKGVQFCPVMQIEPYFRSEVTERLQHLNYLKGLNSKEFVKISANLFAEVNIVHPFREGNGRSQREFFRNLALVNGFDLNWSNVTDKEMINASIQSTIDSNEGLEKIFDNVLEYK